MIHTAKTHITLHGTADALSRRAVRLAAAAAMLAVSAFAPATTEAQKVRIGGALAQELDYLTEEEELSMLSTQAEITISAGLGDAGLLTLTARGEHDAARETDTLELGEAYTALYFDRVDLVVGNQIINWGTADGINPSSVVTPLDLESLTDEEPRWEPVAAVRATYYLGNAIEFTGVAVLDFVPMDLSGPAFSTLAKLPASSLPDEPEASPESFEYAAKVGAFLAGFDLRASYFYGYTDLPALATTVSLDPGTLEPIPGSESLAGRYRRVNRFGVAAAGELLTAGVWGEAAYVVPEKVDLGSDDPLTATFELSSDEPRFEAVAGIDYTFPGGLYAEAQYLYYGPGGLPEPYAAPGKKLRHSHLALSTLSYSFGLDHEVELGALADAGNGAALLIPSVTLGLAPATSLRVAGVLPFGEEESLAGGTAQAVTATFATEF